MEINITTFHGLEHTLAEEIKLLGGEDVSIGRRVVTCYGDKSLLYRLNYCLRTGLRVLIPIQRFKANDPDELYQGVRKTDLSAYITPDKSIAIDVVAHSEYFTHSKYATYRVKDAIMDQLRERYDQRTNIDTKLPDFRLNVHIRNDEVILSADSSGEPLFKRNYRKVTGKAPLNEILAAGIVMISGWDKKMPFVDPMAGSGTIAIEAAMLASNMPAQYMRREFGFTKWRDFNPDLWTRIKGEENAKVHPLDVPIIASDIHPSAIDAIYTNIEKFEFNDEFKVVQSDFFETEIHGAHIVFNPPYDHRLDLQDSESFYRELGTHLKHQCGESQAWIFSGNLLGFKHIGLKSSKRVTLFNGPIESKLMGFDLFSGSRIEYLTGHDTPQE